MRSIAILAMTVISLSCSTLVEPTHDELLTAPSFVTIDARSVVLDVGLWRDFQPATPPDGKPLVAIMRPVREDNGASPAGVRIEAAWVIFGLEKWTADVSEERFASPPEQTHYEVVAREGPKWGPGVSVDVVVRLRDAAGATWLLRAPNQPILRTD